MEKVKLYILQGKGIGLIFLLAAALLAALMMIFLLRGVYTEAKPEVELVAEEFLPVTIKGGKIVEPADTYKKLELGLGGENGDKQIYPIVLDTENDASTFVPSGERGLFILSDVIYAVSAGEIRRISLATQPDGIFDKDDFTALMDKAVGALSSVVSVVLVGFCFVLYLLKTWLIALLAQLGQKVAKKAVLPDFRQLMRLGAVVVAVIEVLAAAGSFMFGMQMGGFRAFVVEALAVAAVLYFNKFEDSPIQA